MNDIELKLKLATELPDLIEYLLENKTSCQPNANRHWYFYWKDTPAKTEITEREWDWVIFELQRRASDERFRYRMKQMEMFPENKVLTWQQKAEAYFKVKEKYAL